MTKIKLMIDDVLYKEKPNAEDAAMIKTRFKNQKTEKELTIEELKQVIGSGHTFIPAVLRNGIKNENWVQQQLIGIDIDNTNENEKQVTPEELISFIKNRNLDVLGYYYTFSSSPNKIKFRLLFLLDEPIYDKNKMSCILKLLVENIPQADRSCKDLARHFYGTNDINKVIICNENATITLNNILNLESNLIVPHYIENTELKQLISNFDLLEYMKQNDELSYHSGNITGFKTCSICGHKDDLVYFHDTNKFKCFGQHGDVGGTIIDYLMATKKMTVAEAINYFKYSLLGFAKPEITYSGASISQQALDHITIVKDQLRKIGLNVEFTGQLNWIEYSYNNHGVLKCKVLCPELAQYIRENFAYIFVRNNAKDGILKYFYLDNYYKLVSDEEQKGLIKELIPLPLQQSRDYNEVSNLLNTDLRFVDIENLNADENIINFNNGVLHLDTGELKPHSPNYLSTIRIPCDYMEEIEQPKTAYFDRFINDLTNGDEEVKRLILQFMGVILSNIHGYRMKQALFMTGAGNTGKSKLKILLTSLIGKQNCSSVDLKTLEQKFSKVQLLNKRLVGSNDMSYMTISELETFKQATGGDPIHAEFKGENPIDFIFNGVLWFAGNKLPKFGGDRGDWVYDRIVLIECKNVISEEKQDKNLDKHLLEEKEYIVSLAIKELRNVIKNGYRYDIPESCKLLKEQYKIDNNSFLSFLEDCTIPRNKNIPPKDRCTKGMVYKVYKAWCKDNNRGYYETKGEVKKLLEKLQKNQITKTNNGNEYYEDFTLRDEIKREYEEVYGFFDGDEKATVEKTQTINEIPGLIPTEYDF